MLSSIITTQINVPSECFSISVSESDYPFNVSFTIKDGFSKNEDLYGPGIYSIFDKTDNSLVYVGLWTPESQSAVKERYYKHIQTLTLRGSKVKFNKKPEFTLDCFLDLLTNESLISAITNSSSMINSASRLHTGGIVSAINKIKYADSQWDDIGTWDTTEKAVEGFDKKYYFQFDKIVGFFDEGLTKEEVKKQLKNKFESPLINSTNPLSNTEYKAGLPTLKYTNEKGGLGAEIISKFISDIVKPKSKIESLKRKLVALVEEINAQGSDYKVKFNQQKVNTYNMSISGANGRMYVSPAIDGYDVSLLGKSLEGVAYSNMQELFGKIHCGYKQKGIEYQPYWRTDNFELVKQAVYIYSKTTK